MVSVDIKHHVYLLTYKMDVGERAGTNLERTEIWLDWINLVKFPVHSIRWLSSGTWLAVVVIVILFSSFGVNQVGGV